MLSSLRYWIELYEKLRYQTLCLDIEVDGKHGPITLVGFHDPHCGHDKANFHVWGCNLSAEEVRQHLHTYKCKALLTYNGKKWDEQKVRKDLPGALPDKLPVIDLALWSWHLTGKHFSLAFWQRYFNLAPGRFKQRGTAQWLWHQWLSNGRQEWPLNELKEYNRLDLIHLPQIADFFIKEYERRVALSTPRTYADGLSFHDWVKKVAGL